MNVLETSGNVLQDSDGEVTLGVSPSTTVQPGSDGQDKDNQSIPHDAKEEEPACYFHVGCQLGREVQKRAALPRRGHLLLPQTQACRMT